jgi:hypothetical protein
VNARCGSCLLLGLLGVAILRSEAAVAEPLGPKVSDELDKRGTHTRVSALATCTASHRAALLAAHLPDQAKAESVPNVAAGVLVGVGAATTTLALYPGGGLSPSPVAFASSGASALLGGTAVFVVPASAERDTILTAAALSLGGVWLGVGLAEQTVAVRATHYSIAGGYYMTATLHGLNLALSRPASARTLWARDKVGQSNPRGCGFRRQREVDVPSLNWPWSRPAW